MLATQRRPRASLLLVGLALALGLRLAVAGDRGNSSVAAGLVFAVALGILTVSGGWRPKTLRVPPFAIGIVGGLVLIAAPVWLRVTHSVPLGQLPISSFPPWAVVVAAVAVTEEVLLRGVLFSLIERASGTFAAAASAALIFAFMHVPLYGWGAFPLDLAVGLWLGGLRLIARSVIAPATAHTLADLASWWIV